MLQDQYKGKPSSQKPAESVNTSLRRKREAHGGGEGKKQNLKSQKGKK